MRLLAAAFVAVAGLALTQPGRALAEVQTLVFDSVTACSAYPSPRPEPTSPDLVSIALLKRPSGPMQRVRSTWVGDYVFGAQRVTIPRGTRFTWRFVGSTAHDVTLATGPVGFASPSLKRGSYSFRFTRPGTYRLFCSLHPARMTEVVRVR